MRRIRSGSKKMLRVFFVVISVFLIHPELASSQELNTNKFPDDFVFGVATAAAQIEGAWNESDRSESIWDYMAHNYPELVYDGSNADVACDSYHHIEDDVSMMKDLGVNFYRFSIAWPRILPNGYANYVSETGLEYYNKLIDALLENGITPMVTIYHNDLPQVLQTLGGWANPIIADYYADFANVAFEHFGDRVKHWITFNEPYQFCALYGKEGVPPVEVSQSGVADYLCTHNVLLSHAKAYHLYEEKYRGTQNGSVGITLDVTWLEPNSTSSADVVAAQRGLQFNGGLYAHPIFSKEGDYPEVVKRKIAERSAREGFPRSRLPSFSEEEVEYIKGTFDFFGLNHYFTYLVADAEPNYETVSFDNDPEIVKFISEDWEIAIGSDHHSVAPWGFTKLLLWLRDEYQNPPIYITENGYIDHGKLEDTERVSYHQKYLSAVLDAIDQGVNVKGYAVWSLMDNWEWTSGYSAHYGLYYVDMDDPNRTRTPKTSVDYYKEVIATRKVIVTENETK